MADNYLEMTPAMSNPISASGQMQLLPYISPDQVAQNQAAMLGWQQKNALAQQLMGAPLAQQSGRGGVIANGLTRILGMLQNRNNQQNLTSILKDQFAIENQAAQAKRAQDLQDEYRKLQEKIYETAQGEKAKRDYAPLKFEGGGSFDPSSGQWTAAPGYADQEVSIAGAKANAEAKARAAYAGAGESAKLGMIQKVMGMPDSPQKTAMLSSLVGEGGMQAMMFGGGMGGGQGGPVSSGPTGDDFLKTLNPGMANQVKAIAEGRQAPPTSMAMRSPMGQALMQAVAQYDPTFDATNYAARSKTRNAFTAGKEGQNLNALNTAIGHAGTLLDAANALDNTPYPAVNSVLNAFSQAGGSEKVGNFNITRDAVAGEMTKAFRGAGGSEKDIEEMRTNLNAANSPEQLRGVIGKSIMLLGSKAQSLNDQYQQAFSNQSAPNFLDPHAKATLQKLQKQGVDLGPLGEAYGLSGQGPTGQLSDAELLKKYGGG